MQNNPSQLNRGEYGFNETKYSHFLCFSVQIRTNKLVFHQSERYTPEQQELHKNLHDSGMSYRRITKLLNKKGIKTHTGKEWSVTGSSVHSVLKKYRQREERLELINNEYELEWGTMEVKWERNSE